MRHPMAAPTSGLPSLMMPCPTCAGRVVYHSRRIAAPDMEDTIYACRGCGTEVIRTSMSKAKGAEAA